MANVRIEVLRCGNWTVRQEGDMEITADALAAHLKTYAIQYAHRAFLDGVQVAEVAAPARRTR